MLFTFHVTNTATLHMFDMEKVVEMCKGYSGKVESIQSLGSQSLQYVTDGLIHIDHIFVISTQHCTTMLPAILTKKATCVFGKNVDKCAPPKLLAGKYEHAMKVTFSHAFVIQLALQSQYRHIAIIEDDIEFVSRNFSWKASTHLHELVMSDSWSLIRLGYRPYFLERTAIEPCPRQCRCIISTFGPHLCRLNGRSCDLRSSDLYILNSASFATLQKKLLDVSVANSKRIIDTHPTQALANQWLLLPQISFQRTLDVPVDYQLGAGALYMSKCVGPRPLEAVLIEPLHK